MENNSLKSKQGWIVPLATVVVASITMAGSIIGARISADASINEKISDVKREAAITATKVELNETGIRRDFERMEEKIDWLVKERGGVPDKIVANEN